MKTIIQMKRYVYVRNLFTFLVLFLCQKNSFGQEVEHVKGELAFNLLGYPTLYGLDSITHARYLKIFEKKRLKRKYESLKNEYQVYHELKKTSCQEYPCIQVQLNDNDSNVFVYMRVNDYHKIIAKNQEQLDKDSLVVTLELSIVEIIPGYYKLLELENLEFIKNQFLRREKFGYMDYVW